jgi:hypothetical protein
LERFWRDFLVFDYKPRIFEAGKAGLTEVNGKKVEG